MRNYNADYDEKSTLNTYISEIQKVPLLTREEEYDLAVRAKNGDQVARNRLIEANSRFVISVAKKYQGRGLDLEDLISEGNIGLVMAVDKFEPQKGFHFISYGVWWIRQAILKALADKSRMIRLPMNKAGDFVQVQAIKNRLEQENDKVELCDIAAECSLSEEEVKELLSLKYDVTSLETPLSQEEGHTLADVLESDVQSPEESLLDNDLKFNIDKALEGYSEKERQVIIRRFGLHDTKPLSLKEIGDIYQLSKERIRQIEKKVITNLQDNSDIQELAGYLA